MFPPPSPSQSTINEKKTKTFIDLQEILLLLLLMLLSRCRTPPKPPARRHHVWTCRLRLSALPTGVLRRLHSAALATSGRATPSARLRVECMRGEKAATRRRRLLGPRDRVIINRDKSDR